MCNHKMSRKLFNFLCDATKLVCATVFGTVFIAIAFHLVGYVTLETITESDLKYTHDKEIVADVLFALVLAYVLFSAGFAKTPNDFFQFMGIAAVAVLGNMVLATDVAVMVALGGWSTLKSEFFHVCVATAVLTGVVLGGILGCVVVDVCCTFWRKYKGPDEQTKKSRRVDEDTVLLAEKV